MSQHLPANVGRPVGIASSAGGSLTLKLMRLRLIKLQIVDGPRFTWRGALLDVGRHYFSVPFILKFLDSLALHKINKFHWHLTEDQVI